MWSLGEGNALLVVCVVPGSILARSVPHRKRICSRASSEHVGALVALPYNTRFTGYLGPVIVSLPYASPCYCSLPVCSRSLAPCYGIEKELSSYPTVLPINSPESARSKARIAHGVYLLEVAWCASLSSALSSCTLTITNPYRRVNRF